MGNQININGTPIGINYPPYIVAEMSANHNGSLKEAMKIIRAAKIAGADAVKLQTYLPDTITLKSDSEDFLIRDGLWEGQTLYELYEWAHTPWEWHRPLFNYAKELGITLFSSPFDPAAVDLLEELNCPAYKVASFEAVDLPLIKYVASTGKPMIISTGMANAEEIQEAIEAAQSGGCRQLALLQCVSSYPAPATDYNLRTIPDMMNKYGVVAGISDHTIDNSVSIASVALGGSIIEKHFTLDRNGNGPDDSFSIEHDQLTQLCQDAKTAWEALGKVDYVRQSSEESNIKFRRSLYFVKSLKAGDIIHPECVRSVRPGYGLAPKHLGNILGKRLVCDIEINTPVKIEFIE